MRLLTVGLSGLATAALAVSSASAQDTVRIGVVLTLSGQFADAGVQLDNGIKTYMKQHGDTVAGKKIEIIRKDVGGVAPDLAKRLAQELIVRDKVEVGVSANLSIRRYLDEFDDFGYHRDNERVQPFVFARYQDKSVTAFASVSKLYGRWHDVDFSNVDRTLFDASLSWRAAPFTPVPRPG